MSFLSSSPLPSRLLLPVAACVFFDRQCSLFLVMAVRYERLADCAAGGGSEIVLVAGDVVTRGDATRFFVCLLYTSPSPRD